MIVKEGGLGVSLSCSFLSIDPYLGEPYTYGWKIHIMDVYC
jgi:hypothetical protein